MRSPSPGAQHPSVMAPPPPTPKHDRSIQIELVDGPVPWTHLRPYNDEDTFQFAIVTDRTGGMRRGVFASAVRKLNLLKPELVMSVGDLIEGYTEDRALLGTEWDEFDTLVRGLEAPFFYVPGNHDLTNPVMQEVWQQRYGKAYYAFVYRDVLFVCLNTNDGELHHVSDEQVTWLRRVLGQHENVRWTLLFMHTPLWDDSLGHPGASHGYHWSRIEAALGDRKYTAFAGHHHRYVKQERHSRKHFTLATTGGGSSLRGPAYGEFDHVMWVTMTEDGPQIANLMLDGIWNENVRTEELRNFEYSLLGGDSLKPEVVYYEHTFKTGTSRLLIQNNRDVPFDFELETAPDTGLEVTPTKLAVQVPPNSVHEALLRLSSRLASPGPALRVPVTWSATARSSVGDTFRFTGKTALSLIKLGRIPRTFAPKRLDGKLTDWVDVRLTKVTPTQVLRDQSTYHGPEDNRFEVGLARNDDTLFVAVRVHDDSVRAEKTKLPWNQDGIEVRVDARPDPRRSHSHGELDGQGIVAVAMSPSSTADDDWYAPEHLRQPEGAEASCVRSADGFVTEIAIPLSRLNRAAGGRAERVRVNVAVNDRDADGQSQLWWWPDWRSAEDIPGSGTFALSK